METTINKAKDLVSKIIEKSIKDQVYMPIYLHSSPGIGKSAIVRQIADDNEMGFVDVRLAQMEQSDVQGIPFVNETEHGHVMDMSIPEWFPTADRINRGEFPEKGILFFDEMSNAPISVQHAAYRIVLDREIHHGTKLADGWVIVSAGNTKEDKTGAKGVAPALANRYAVHITIRPSLDDFMGYAVENKFDESVIGFLNFNSSMLYRFDPKKNDVAFATPRSWEQVNNLLDIPFSDDELAMAVSGCIGDGASAEFMAFRKYYSKLPNMKKIMEGKLDYKVPSDSGVLYALCSSIITNLIEYGENREYVKNLVGVMKQLEDDFTVLIIKTLSRHFDQSKDPNRVQKMKNFVLEAKGTFQEILSKYGRS